MSLANVIRTMNSRDTCTMLDALLDRGTETGVSWGRRWVTVNGYKGSVSLDLILEKFFYSVSFSLVRSAKLEERLLCSNVWHKLRALCEESDQKVAALGIKRLAGFYKPARYAPLNEPGRIRCTYTFEFTGREESTDMFLFREDEFRTLWTGQRPPSYSSISGNLDNLVIHYPVTREMVEAAIAKRKAEAEQNLSGGLAQ